jgi:hypothetical protein
MAPQPVRAAAAVAPHTPRVAYRLINLPSRRGKRRVMELQFRALGIDAATVAAFDGDGGRAILPHSPLRGGELGLVATWAALLADTSAAAADWVVVVEDDALLRPSLRRELPVLLAAAPSAVQYVQLGWVTPGSWRGGNPIHRNVARRIRHTWRMRGRRRTPSDDLQPDLLDGTHLHAVRLRGVEQWVAGVATSPLPLDKFIAQRSRDVPGSAVRAGRTYGVQVPMGSDIISSRRSRQRRGGDQL